MTTKHIVSWSLVFSARVSDMVTSNHSSPSPTERSCPYCLRFNLVAVTLLVAAQHGFDELEELADFVHVLLRDLQTRCV